MSEGDGRVSRFRAQTQQHFPDIVTQAMTFPGDDRTQWLLKKLEALATEGDETASTIVEAFREDRRRNALEHAQRARYRLVKALKAQMEGAAEKYHPGFQKRIARVEREIYKAIQRHGPLLSEQEIAELQEL